ncbi:hypothetical protein DM02DRAFT_7843 [Periconia macrospinosa]|uniref:Uncharacterized protein n=1 Tax=Periconia macrospinosa TaxID=97972 RepID=A0A2V1EE23_9PLEO|nr:hypothetical protein DM02DRAFT_7843 [Periconia macrospinosa]
MHIHIHHLRNLHMYATPPTYPSIPTQHAHTHTHAHTHIKIYPALPSPSFRSTHTHIILHIPVPRRELVRACIYVSTYLPSRIPVSRACISFNIR